MRCQKVKKRAVANPTGVAAALPVRPDKHLLDEDLRIVPPDLLVGEERADDVVFLHGGIADEGAVLHGVGQVGFGGFLRPAALPQIVVVNRTENLRTDGEIGGDEGTDVHGISSLWAFRMSHYSTRPGVL